MNEDLFQQIIDLRRDLHSHPELSMEEVRTSGVVVEQLKSLGYEPRIGIAKTGVMATLDTGKDGPHLLFRGDMDALPIQEETGLDFASKHSNVMHACGHDAHTAMLWGASALLKQSPPAAGKVSFLFQPAEEKFGGAQIVVQEGHLKGIDQAYGFHLDYHYDVGQIALQSGSVTSNQDGIQIEVNGESCHAARPHQGIDAIVIAAHLITQMQTLVSRRSSPVVPTVLTIGMIQGGSAANVVAGKVSLRGTLRTIEDDTREMMIEALQQCCTGLAAAHDGEIKLTVNRGYPAVLNAAETVDIATRAIHDVLGPEAALPMREVNMAAEDFAYISREVPSCLMRLGCRYKDRVVYPTHSSKFDFDESAMRIAPAIFQSIAYDVLGKA